MPGNDNVYKSTSIDDITDSNVAIGENAGVFIDQIIQLGATDDPDFLQNAFVGAFKELGFDRFSVQQLDQGRPSPETQLQIDRLEQFVEKSTAAGVPITAQTAYYMGMLAVYRGDRGAALNHFHRAAALDPEMTQVFRTIGWLEQSQAITDLKNGDYAAAKAGLGRAENAAMGIVPPDAWALAMRGYCAKTRGQIAAAEGRNKQRSKRYAEAADFFLESLQLNPNNAEAFNGLGNVYIALNNFDGAIESCTQAIRLAPHYTHAYHDLAYAYQLRMGEEEDSAAWVSLWEKARLAWEQAHDLAGLDPDQAARARLQQEVKSQLKRLDIAMRRHKLLHE